MQNGAVLVVDSNPLIFQRNKRQERRAHGPRDLRRLRLVRILLRPPRGGGIGKAHDREQGDGGDGESGEPRFGRPGGDHV